MFHNYTLENIRKPAVFWRFQGYRKGTLIKNELIQCLSFILNCEVLRRMCFHDDIEEVTSAVIQVVMWDS